MLGYIHDNPEEATAWKLDSNYVNLLDDLTLKKRQFVCGNLGNVEESDKRVNFLIGWNDVVPKYDIREWSPDAYKMGKDGAPRRRVHCDISCRMNSSYSYAA